MKILAKATVLVNISKFHFFHFQFHYTWKRLFQDVIDGYVRKCKFPIKAVLD